MDIENLIDGLQLLKANGAEGFCVAAEHDVLYVGNGDKPVPKKVRNKLLDLGWHWDGNTESWGAFT